MGLKLLIQKRFMVNTSFVARHSILIKRDSYNNLFIALLNKTVYNFGVIFWYGNYLKRGTFREYSDKGYIDCFA